MFILLNTISNFRDKVFVLSFQDTSEIKLLQQAYKDYERIIKDLQFNGENVLIDNEKAHLTYVFVYINKFRKLGWYQKI